MRLCGTVWLCVLAAAHSIYAADNISANANAGASPFTADIVVDPTCLWKAERSIASGCGLGDEGRLRAETAALVHACVQFADDPVLRRLRVIAGVARLYPELQRLSTEFSAATGIPTYFNFSNAIGGSGHRHHGSTSAGMLQCMPVRASRLLPSTMEIPS
ncbi:hypothetical protein CHLRE_12g534961v5 [Chlamydomonas reinhardtii]|uniref:Uncharacterized protein n=1 Tax=Chlamydomonas reinhardtii TaxID=3055 RepID=A0A2K3D531_CHLRE|nr:uncharacterized protein CHLRE_12g534961v5 [Chlamydomonas reinhardtii]PNW75640.1 hypothetical protein CHLRE_12g534961v5 [Chlamydomonas reinhardtii]